MRQQVASVPMIRTPSIAAAISILVACSLFFSMLVQTSMAGDSKAGDGPDLVISSLTASLVGGGRVSYSFTITNVGNKPANLDGPTDSNPDNVSVQAFISKDTLFRNKGDLPAGGTIVGLSPLGYLKPGRSRKGSFSASISGDVRELPYLILMVDWGNAVDESNEDNNLAIVGIAHKKRNKETSRIGRKKDT